MFLLTEIKIYKEKETVSRRFARQPAKTKEKVRYLSIHEGEQKNIYMTVENP